MDEAEFAQRAVRVEIRVICFRDLRCYPEARGAVFAHFDEGQRDEIMSVVSDYYADEQQEGHPHISAGTRLVKLSQETRTDSDGEVTVIYCIPESIRVLYLQQLEREASQ
jgi:hypothetical protein